MCILQIGKQTNDAVLVSLSARSYQIEANPEVKEAAMREMMLVSEEMGALLKQHKIHFPKMILSMFGQFPVFVSLFLATRDVSVAC